VYRAHHLAAPYARKHAYPLVNGAARDMLFHSP
jgi:hypothetical protein